jgi:epoxyqueuosine reductase QueG
MSATDPAQAKAQVMAYARRHGALAVGVASVADIERVAPPGHRPSDVLPRVRSVISVGVGGPTAGDWFKPAKALAFNGGSESAAYRIAYGLAYFIELNFGERSVFCPPDPDPSKGTRVAMQSLKLHAELAGIGARSIAGDILLHPEFGFMYYASTFTELELAPDAPMATNPCPAPSCVTLYERTGKTPCMKFCPVQCLHATIENRELIEARYEMYKCAELTQQYEPVPSLLERILDEPDPLERKSHLFGPQSQELWYKMAIGEGESVAQCFECMRVCPIARTAPAADPVKRWKLRQEIPLQST